MCKLYGDVLTGGTKALLYVLHPVVLANLAKIEKVAKTIERIASTLEHTLHHVLLATIETVADVTLQLPHAAQFLLKR